jgi:hypothetical protein
LSTEADYSSEIDKFVAYRIADERRKSEEKALRANALSAQAQAEEIRQAKSNHYALGMIALGRRYIS